jgi:hypothetical protein
MPSATFAEQPQSPHGGGPKSFVPQKEKDSTN